MEKKINNLTYKIENKILGKGAFGKVYLGTIKETEDKVALKELPKEVEKDKEALDSISNEIAISSKLDNTNIVKMLEITEIDNKQYLIYEFCNGGDLRKYMNYFGRFDEELIQIIIIKLINGLFELNKKKVIHHDIKPENILIQLFPEEKYTKEIEMKIESIKEFTKKRKQPTINNNNIPYTNFQNNNNYYMNIMNNMNNFNNMYNMNNNNMNNMNYMNNNNMNNMNMNNMNYMNNQMNNQTIYNFQQNFYNNMNNQTPFETEKYLSNQPLINFQTNFVQNNINNQIFNNVETLNYFNNNQTAGNLQPNFINNNINPSFFQNNNLNILNQNNSCFNTNSQVNPNNIAIGFQNNNNINNNPINNNQNNNIIDREKEIINVLKNAQYKLSDFGLSKIRYDIKARNLAGSPLYMSPELFNPNASIKTIENYQVDIWALGVLAFEMFFGRRPFEAFSIEELSKMYHKSKTYEINLNSISISKEFFSFLNMCLQEDPKIRANVEKLQNSKFVNIVLNETNKMDGKELLECLGNEVEIDNKTNNIKLRIDKIYFEEEEII